MLLSLFSGCGGLDLGFERAGFDIGLAYDIRPYSVASWNRNRPAGAERGHIANLSVIRLRDMDRDHGSRFVPSGVIGGTPCQSFSRANRSPSLNDDRRRLVRHFFSIALRFHRARRPLDFILMENVPELDTGKNRGLLEQEVRRLEDHGFAVRRFLLDAAQHSVPQHRKRLFVLAVPEKAANLDGWAPPCGGGKVQTVEAAIRGLPEPRRFERGIQAEAIPVHPNHWCMTPKSPRFFDGSLKAGDSSGRSFKTLAWDAPSVTVSYGHREVHVHPDGHRRLSVLEAMRLQGFPDSYILEGTLSAQIDQVSEAVPPLLAETVARSISAVVSGANKTTDGATYLSSESRSCNTEFG